jgi:hypothetical protein
VTAATTGRHPRVTVSLVTYNGMRWLLAAWHPWRARSSDLGSYLRDLPWIAQREVMSLLFILWNDPGDLAAVIDLANYEPRSMRKRRVLWSRIQADRGSLHAQVR